MLVLIGFVVRGWAGEAELEVERGRVAYELERYQDARQRAIEALGRDPALGSAQQLYLDASTAGGLGSRGLYELVESEPGPPPGGELTASLVAHLEGHDWRGVRDDVEKIGLEWPLAPDLLLPLWSATDRKVARLRQRLLAGLVHPEALAAAEPEALYRLRRLAIEVGVDHAAIDQALVDRGEDAPPPRLPLGRLERTELADRIIKDPIPELPWGYPSELVEVGLRLQDGLDKARRHRHVALAWQQIQRVSDDPVAWTREALAWLAEGELDKAVVAADAAVSRATRPRNIDVAALNTDRQRQDLAQALLARARVREATADPVRAYADYATAVVLAGEALDDRLGERLEEASAAAAQQLQARYRGAVPAERALQVAAGKTERDDVTASTTEARFLAAYGSRGVLDEAPEVYAQMLGAAFRLDADAELKAGRLDDARTAIVLATVLAGEDHPHWWVARAQMQDRNGEYDAAFASWSIARGRGVRGLDADLERTYAGPSTWEIAANNLGGPPPQVAAVEEPLLRAARSASTRSRVIVDRPATAPRIGQRFPSFSVDTGYGALTDRALAGRVTVLVFWEERCAECLQMLPAFGTLARRLRKEGRDVRVVGVGVDQDPAAFERVYTKGQDWAELVWAPTLRDRFAIVNVPTAWIVDPGGVARYYVDHWLSVEELDRYVRDLD